VDTYNFRTSAIYPERFENTGALTASVARRLPAGLSLSAEVGSMSYARTEALGSPAGSPRPFRAPAAFRLQVRIVQVGLNLRCGVGLPGEPPARIYVESGPALYLTRWEETVSYEQGAETFSPALPGWTAGGGLELLFTKHLGVDAHFRYLWSRDAGYHSLCFSGGDFAGLRQGVLGLALRLEL
jgi:opacity protein-like surface antigen